MYLQRENWEHDGEGQVPESGARDHPWREHLEVNSRSKL